MKFVPDNIRKGSLLYASLLLLIIGFGACNSAKQVTYFQDVPDSTNVVKRVHNTPYVETVIHKGDILNIEVTTIDAEIGGIAKEKQSDGGGKGEDVTGYMVDKNGFVEVPIIGKLQIEGLTTIEVKELVRKNALKFYKDPLINIRIVNFYITVLGQVNRPGRYVVSSEKVNIIDAIGLAGDLSLGGKRNNVMIIREENGESVFTRVDLNSTDVFQSKYYYLQSGDKIYVEPLKAMAKTGTRDQAGDRILAISLGLATMAFTLINLTLRIK